MDKTFKVGDRFIVICDPLATPCDSIYRLTGEVVVESLDGVHITANLDGRADNPHCLRIIDIEYQP